VGEVAGERVEARLPEPAVALDPAGGVLHRARASDEPAAAHPAVLRMRDEARPLEDAEMLVDAGERDPERTREFGNGGVVPREPGENRAARGVGECREGGVEPPVLILNHMVRSCALRGRCQGSLVYWEDGVTEPTQPWAPD
jgi:hypothetical protein